MAELKREYRDGEPRPDLPAGWKWRQEVRERPGDDVREYDRYWVPVAPLTDEQRERQRQVAEEARRKVQEEQEYLASFPDQWAEQAEALRKEKDEALAARLRAEESEALRKVAVLAAGRPAGDLLVSRDDFDFGAFQRLTAKRLFEAQTRRGKPTGKYLVNRTALARLAGELTP